MPDPFSQLGKESDKGLLKGLRENGPTAAQASLVGGSGGKESACNEGDLGSSPGLGRSPGGGHGNPTPVFLPGEFPWTEEPGGLQSMGSKRLSD